MRFLTRYMITGSAIGAITAPMVVTVENPTRTTSDEHGKIISHTERQLSKFEQRSWSVLFGSTLPVTVPIIASGLAGYILIREMTDIKNFTWGFLGRIHKINFRDGGFYTGYGPFPTPESYNETLKYLRDN